MASLVARFDALSKEYWRALKADAMELQRHQHVLNVELGIDVAGEQVDEVSAKVRELRHARKRLKTAEAEVVTLEGGLEALEGELRRAQARLKGEEVRRDAAEAKASKLAEQLEFIRELVSDNERKSLGVEESFAIVDSRKSLALSDRASMLLSPRRSASRPRAALYLLSDDEGEEEEEVEGRFHGGGAGTPGGKSVTWREKEVSARSFEVEESFLSTASSARSTATPDGAGAASSTASMEDGDELAQEQSDAAAASPAPNPEEEGSPVSPTSPTSPTTPPTAASAAASPKTPRTPGGTRIRRHNLEPHTTVLPLKCDFCHGAIGFKTRYLKCNQCLKCFHTQCEINVPNDCCPPAFGSPAARRRKPPALGASLGSAIMAEGPHAPFPLIIASCINTLDRRALQQVDLYKRGCIAANVRALKNRFFASHATDRAPNLYTVSNVHEVAALLLLYLRELDEPILCFDLYGPMVHAVDTSSGPRRVLEVVCLLPALHFYSLRAIALHLGRVSQHIAENKMSVHALSQIFAPLLTQSPEGAVVNGKDAVVQQKIVQRLIDIREDEWDEAEAYIKSQGPVEIELSPPPTKPKRKRSSSKAGL